MSAAQADLFGAPPAGAAPPPSEEAVALVRDRLRATLALLKGAQAIPRGEEHLAIVRGDNAFRFVKDLLPPEKAASLWAESNAEMDRLYAIMNAGKDPDDRPHPGPTNLG